jgi:hypothetical protein
MDARLDQVADAVKARLEEAWGDHDFRIEVADSPFVEVNDRENADFLKTRTILIVPIGYSFPGMVSRSEENQDHTLRIGVFELFTNEGPPSTAWIRERKQWVEESIIDVLFDSEAEPILGTCIPDTGDVVIASDPEMLRVHKVFYSEIEIVYREIV